MIPQGDEIAINIIGDFPTAGNKISIDIGGASAISGVSRIAIGYTRIGGNVDPVGVNGSFRTADGILVVRNGLIVSVIDDVSQWSKFVAEEINP